VEAPAPRQGLLACQLKEEVSLVGEGAPPGAESNANINRSEKKCSTVSSPPQERGRERKVESFNPWGKIGFCKGGDPGYASEQDYHIPSLGEGEG